MGNIPRAQMGAEFGDTELCADVFDASPSLSLSSLYVTPDHSGNSWTYAFFSMRVSWVDACPDAHI